MLLKKKFKIMLVVATVEVWDLGCTSQSEPRAKEGTANAPYLFENGNRNIRTLYGLCKLYTKTTERKPN